MEHGLKWAEETKVRTQPEMSKSSATDKIGKTSVDISKTIAAKCSNTIC